MSKHAYIVTTDGEPSRPGLAKTPTERQMRVRKVLADGDVTFGQLAVRWRCSPQRAEYIVKRRSGLDTERFLKLAPKWRGETGT